MVVFQPKEGNDMTDLRSKRSVDSIKKAFIDLTLSRGMDHVTVSEITKQAFINRQTFYLHYLDKFDLAHQVASDFFDKTTKFYKDTILTHHYRNEVLMIMCNYLTAHYREIIVLHEVQSASDDLNQEIEERMMDFIQVVSRKHVSEFNHEVYMSLINATVDFMIKYSKIPSDKDIIKIVEMIREVQNADNDGVKKYQNQY